jgi:hypothetical protein
VSSVHLRQTSVTNFDNYDPSFIVLKDDTEILPLNFFSCDAEVYSTPFIMDDLLAALECCHNMFTGSDIIHNQMLCHLLSTVKELCCSCTTGMSNSMGYMNKKEYVLILSVTEV